MVNSSDKDKKEKEAKEDALKVCYFVLSVSFQDKNHKPHSIRKFLDLILFFQTNVIPSKEKSTKVTEEDKKVSFYCFIISIHLFIIIAV